MMIKERIACDKQYPSVNSISISSKVHYRKTTNDKNQSQVDRWLSLLFVPQKIKRARVAQ